MGRCTYTPAASTSSPRSSSSRFLIYNEVVKTSKVYLRDSTTVSPQVLLLFGGKLVVHHEKEAISLAIDKKRWLHFKAPRKVATVVKLLRRETEELLLRKITHPDEELSVVGERLIAAVSELLESDHQASMRLEEEQRAQQQQQQQQQGGSSGFGGGGGFGSGEVKAGDWQCPSCQANNFASRNVCFRCQTPKPTASANATSNSAYLATNNVSGGSRKGGGVIDAAASGRMIQHALGPIPQQARQQQQQQPRSTANHTTNGNERGAVASSLPPGLPPFKQQTQFPQLSPPPPGLMPSPALPNKPEGVMIGPARLV